MRKLSIGGLAKIAAAIALAGCLIAVAPRADAQPAPGSPEKLLLDSANRERAQLGLAPLHWDEGLAQAARQHALVMAQRGTIAHQFAGEPDLLVRVHQSGARFFALAENVAEGPSANGLHAQWMNSPPHRENILNPEMNALGAAVELRGGLAFGVEDFSLAIEDISLREQQDRMAAQLRRHGLQLIGDDSAAHRLCEGRQASSSNLRGSFLVRFSAVDLDGLPEVLNKELGNRRYRAAAVAACDGSQNAADFSAYQLAVVLYQ